MLKVIPFPPAGETDTLELILETDDDDDEVFFLWGPVTAPGGFNCVAFLNPSCEQRSLLHLTDQKY